MREDMMVGGNKRTAEKKKRKNEKGRRENKGRQTRVKRGRERKIDRKEIKQYV
jgi:hypothetical protein